MKKALSLVVTTTFLASSLLLASCSGDGSDNTEGTTTGGLDIGIASEAQNRDTAAANTDTTGTATDTTGGVTPQ